VPLELTEAQARAFSTRLMLQQPGFATTSDGERKKIAAELDRRVKGLPPGAFMALDSLRLLADQGNKVAKWLFEHECERLGLTRPTFSIAGTPQRR
jgi:hypothetical protein